jgi:hypothetical protein
MPCSFAGIFYLGSITNRSLTCHFIGEDENSIHTVNMIYYAPSITEPDPPFYEPVTVQPQNVYAINGVMAIENANYTAPLVSVSSCSV